MRTPPSLGIMLCTAAVIAAPLLAATVRAQQAPGTAPVSGAPPANSTLAVATVKLDNGWRASKLIGATVYNDQDQKIGSVDDLILTDDNKVVVAIVSVGGFLGIGSKLVAIPYHDLRFGQDRKVMMPGASKEALNGMPNFTYGS